VFWSKENNFTTKQVHAAISSTIKAMRIHWIQLDRNLEVYLWKVSDILSIVWNVYWIPYFVECVAERTSKWMLEKLTIFQEVSEYHKTKIHWWKWLKVLVASIKNSISTIPKLEIKMLENYSYHVAPFHIAG